MMTPAKSASVGLVHARSTDPGVVEVAVKLVTGDGGLLLAASIGGGGAASIGVLEPPPQAASVHAAATATPPSRWSFMLQPGYYGTVTSIDVGDACARTLPPG